jgi:amino acid transporter
VCRTHDFPNVNSRARAFASRARTVLRMNIGKQVRSVLVGGSRSLSDQSLFHKVSLIAALAWVGLGADGLSSSCYGPEESFKALGAHVALAPLIGLAAMITIAVICFSYSQVIELFPGGGGGYLVATKLLSPAAGVVSGCALLVDYVLTIGISIASGADAIFSILPPEWLAWKIPFTLVCALFLTMLNLRGVKESVMLWAPVFFVFVATHGFAILYALATHLGILPEVFASTRAGLAQTHAQLGWLGMFLVLIRAYSVGAGTYTGIEAVSNGLPILREPRVATGKRTMLYMGASLAITVGGLLLAYLLYSVVPQEGKTLNAVLFSQLTAHWPAGLANTFTSVSMISAAALLLIAAQTGFLDGPRVLANMALDRWFPSRFATLSDRFVTQNGILLMGAAAAIVLLATRGSVNTLVVLYSINVFITFSLSQLGMVRHWWKERASAHWKKKLAVNLIGFLLTTFILVMLTITKLSEGGWVTLVVTGLFAALAWLTHRHYARVTRELKRLDELLPVVAADPSRIAGAKPCDPNARTAVLFVNGFNGLGIHTILAITRLFPSIFSNFVFAQIGVVDAGNFKGADEIANLKSHIHEEAERYADYMRSQGFNAETFSDLGHDIIESADELSSRIVARFPNAIFFGGQLVFARETRLTRLLHNFTVFALQRRFFRKSIPFVVIPVRV